MKMTRYNEKIMDRLDQKIDKSRIKIQNKSDDRQASDSVIDRNTSELLNKYYASGTIEQFVGIISSGKEAHVYFAYGENHTPIAVKIYKIDPQNTKWMKNYIIGDPRFKKIGPSTQKIIFTWCSKEFKNLRELHRANIPVPLPIKGKNNILLMEFIGDQNGTPAPRLKDIEFTTDPIFEMNQTLDLIKNMYQKAKLVHGDLSEYNILYWDNKQYIIDVSQAVSIFHANAQIFLQRDIENTLRFYSQYVTKENLPNVEEIMKKIIMFT